MGEDRNSRLSGGVVSGRAKWRLDDEVGSKRGRWREGQAVSVTHKQTFLAFLWKQVALNQLFTWL